MGGASSLAVVTPWCDFCRWAVVGVAVLTPAKLATQSAVENRDLAHLSPLSLSLSLRHCEALQALTALRLYSAAVVRGSAPSACIMCMRRKCWVHRSSMEGRRSWTNAWLPGGAGEQVGQPSLPCATNDLCTNTARGSFGRAEIPVSSPSHLCDLDLHSTVYAMASQQGRHQARATTPPSPATSCLNSENPFDPAIFI